MEFPLRNRPHATANEQQPTQPNKRLRYTLVAIALVLGYFVFKPQPPLPDEVGHTRVASAEQATVPEAPTPPPENHWQKLTVKKGDSLAKLFKQGGIPYTELQLILRDATAKKSLKHIRPGHGLLLGFNPEGQFIGLHYPIDSLQTLTIEKTEAGYRSHIDTKEVVHHTKTASGTIQSSFYVAGQKAGLTPKLITELADLFAWQINFKNAIQKGDAFTVTYEENFVGDKKLGNGHIIAATFTNKHHTYDVARYTDPAGHTGYYTPAGKSIQKALIRYPVKYKRISSRFYRKRYHPILHIVRSHEGVDLAAPRGTPVHAAGDGQITFRARRGGYGNLIIVQHGGRYSTRYGHLSSFSRKFHKGSHVKKGDIIGFVGSTGLASGAHLHFEIRIRGVAYDPLKVKLPTAKSIPEKYLADFKQKTRQSLAALHSTVSVS